MIDESPVDLVTPMIADSLWEADLDNPRSLLCVISRIQSV